MITNNYLKEHFNQTSKIILDIQIAIANANRLYETKYQNEVWVKSHEFFNHYYYQLWFIISIQLCKLLSESKNQHYNFLHLLDDLESKNYDESLLNILESNRRNHYSAVFRDRDEIIEMVQKFRIEFQENDIIIQKFKKLRDNSYAHRDKERIAHDVDLSEAQKLLDLVIKFYNCFHGGFYDIYSNFQNTNDWSIDFILKHVSNSKSENDQKRNNL